MIKLVKYLLLLCLIGFTHESLALDTTAPIAGFARSFITGWPIKEALITVLETGETLKTDKEGKFGPFQYPIGKPLTLELQKFGYKTTQSATVIVPEEGLINPHNNMTFQVPSMEAYYLLKTILGAKEDQEKCHVTATVIGFNKIMDDEPQGEAEAEVLLLPAVNEQAFYFDIFKSGPLKGKTNPFTKGLNKTTDDGGIALFNVPASNQLYSLTAFKTGAEFTKAYFWCRKGAFINISPPRGPMALKQ